MEHIGKINVLVILVIASLGFYSFVHVPAKNEEAIKGLKYNKVEITSEDIALVDKFKNKEKPEVLPSGKFYTKGIINEKEYSMMFYFGDDKSVSKEVVLMGRYKLKGKANYRFDGSVITYSNVEGDRFLFPEIGQAVSIPNESLVVLHDTKRDFALHGVIR